MCSVVFIPLKNEVGIDAEEEYISIEESDLPNTSVIIKILKVEGCAVDVWHRVALLYFRAGRAEDFARICETGYKHKLKSTKPNNETTSVVPIILTMAGYYSQLGYATIDQTLADNYLARASSWYNAADKCGFRDFEVEYYTGRAFLYWYRSEVEQARKHFDFVVAHLSQQYAPAWIGKAHMAYAEKDYTSALLFFRRAFQLEPNCAVNLRLGMGMCFWKLKQFDKAEIAFERAIELYPDDVNAIATLGGYYLSKMDFVSVRLGVGLMVKAYHMSPTHPVALNYLADHFYFMRDLDKSTQLAKQAFKFSRSEDLRMRCAYILGRCHQATGDSKHALHYYYEAIKETNQEFVLPYYALAQSYLTLGNSIDRSRVILNKLLVIDPKNYMAKRMLGSLDCDSKDRVLRTNAQKYLITVLEGNSEDITSLVALATAQESLDDSKALENYKKVVAFFNSKNKPIRAEIYNNMACTCFSLKKYADAKTWFEAAVDAIDRQVVAGDDDSLLVTVHFNIARTHEALCDFRTAESIYKTILTNHPSYYSCFIRLAMIAREKGNFYDASVYFKEALQFSQDHPDVWALSANLHLANQETQLAKQKFQRILNLNEATKWDSYAIVALGNVHLFELQKYMYGIVIEDTRKMEAAQVHHMTRATDLYKMVLAKDPKNIWAAHGIGCIFALKGLFTEAREIFSKIRELATDFKDVWLNIAHIYMEQKMYFNAAQLYESCYRKFARNTDCDLLQHMAKAHYLNGSYDAAKVALLKCLRVMPKNPKVLFMLARTLRKLGWQSLHSGTGDIHSAQSALQKLKQSFTIFTTLKRTNGESVFVKAAADEARFCDDLIKQTPHLISRVEATHKEQQRLKLKREQDIQAYMDSQKKQQMKRESQKRQDDAEVKRRREIVKKKEEAVKQSLESLSMQDRKKKEKETEAIQPVVYYEETKAVAKKPRAKGKRKPTTFLADNIITKRRRTRRSSRILDNDFIFDLSDEHEDIPVIKTENVPSEQLQQIQNEVPLEDKQPLELTVSNEDKTVPDDHPEETYLEMVKVENEDANDVKVFGSPLEEPSVLDALLAEPFNEDESEVQEEEDVNFSIYDGIPLLTAFNGDECGYPETDDDDLPPPKLHSVYSDSE